MGALQRSQNQVSVILPVLNEENYLEAAISAILSQDFLGEFEVILALGPSRDRTTEIAEKLQRSDSRIILVDSPTGKTAAGLNLAIAKSRYPIIIRVDGHATIPKNYLTLATSLIHETGAVNVGGIMAAVGVTGFEKAVATAMRSPLGVGASAFHTGGKAGATDTVYLGAFRKSALQEVGGFDEKFTRAQDWELNFRLRSAGGLVYFDPRLQVEYRPRPRLRALAKQYFEYGRWRRAVSRRHSGTVNFRYLAPPTALLINLLSIFTGLLVSPIFLIPVISYSLLIIFGAVFIGKSWSERLRLPAILSTMHMSWGLGFLTSPKSIVPRGE
ncbi:MAG: glycosyltransferase [Actinobacteria bacterium]|nr:glycosyltransferase [Actinomycetota bacterium]